MPRVEPQIRYFRTKIRPKFASQIRYHPDKVLQELPGAFSRAMIPWNRRQMSLSNFIKMVCTYHYTLTTFLGTIYVIIVHAEAMKQVGFPVRWHLRGSFPVSKCAHSLARHHHASWDPVPATNLNPRLVSVLTSCGPDVHSISATIAPLSFYTLVRRSRHFHLFGSIKSCYPQDPRLHFIHPSHLLSFLHFLCTRNSLRCFISSSSQFWTFQCGS